MKLGDLASTLGKQGLAPVYLVLGEEDYLRDEAIAMIRAAVLGKDEAGVADFNAAVLYGDETTAAEIMESANEAPVFAPRRCVIVKVADRLPSREAERLLPYLKRPSDTATLIVSAAKLDGRTKCTQALKESAVLIDCTLPPEHQLPGWIRHQARRIGLQLQDDAVLLLKDLAISLKELTGGVLYLVRHELEKLASYLPAGQPARAADVEAVRGGEPGASVFDLAQAIAERNRARAVWILGRNLETGEAPLRILGALLWQYRRIWRLKESTRQGGALGEASRALRLPPFKVQAFLDCFSEAHLRHAFRLFLETDAKLKGGAASAPARVLESLLLELGTEKQEVDQPRRAAIPARRTEPARTGGRMIRTVRTVKSGRPSGG